MLTKILNNLLIFLMLAASTTALSCNNVTLDATTSRNTGGVSWYSNNEFCTMNIRPSSGYNSHDYFLEISIPFLQVKGNMPDCNDYVEVFLTSSYRSIGKYCINEGSNLFNMYSHDGYAKITFKSDNSVTGAGFSFTYQLRNKRSTSLVFNSITSCRSYSGTFMSQSKYSQGWPHSYLQSNSACTQKFLLGSYNHARVVFMDIDANKSTSAENSDYVQLQGSNTLYNRYPTSLSKKMTDTSGTLTYTVKNYQYIYMTFNRKRGGPFHRGFLAGIFVYAPGVVIPEKKKSNSNSKSKSKSKSYTKVWASILGVVVFVVVLALIIYKWKQKRSHGIVANQDEAKMAVLATTPDATTPDATTKTKSSKTVVLTQTVNAYLGTKIGILYAPSPYPPKYSRPTPTYSTATACPTATAYQTGPFNMPPVARQPSAPTAMQSVFYPPTSQDYSQGQAPIQYNPNYSNGHEHSTNFINPHHSGITEESVVTTTTAKPYQTGPFKMPILSSAQNVGSAF